MDLEAPILPLPSQPLEETSGSPSMYPSLAVTFNNQQSYLGNISCPFPLGAAFFRPCHRWCEYRPHVGLPASCLSSFPAVLPDWPFRHTSITGPLLCTGAPPAFVLRLAFWGPFAENPRGWADWTPRLPASTSKQLLLISLFCVLELGWRISLTGSMFLKQRNK